MSNAVYVFNTTWDDDPWMVDKHSPAGTVVDRKQVGGGASVSRDGGYIHQAVVPGTEVVVILLASVTADVVNLYSVNFNDGSGSYTDLGSYFDSLELDSLAMRAQIDGSLWVAGVPAGGTGVRAVVIDPGTLAVDKVFEDLSAYSQPLALSKDQSVFVFRGKGAYVVPPLPTVGVSSAGTSQWSVDVAKSVSEGGYDYDLYLEAFVGLLGDDQGLWLTRAYASSPGSGPSRRSSMAVVELSTGAIIQAPKPSDTGVEWENPYGAGSNGDYQYSYYMAYEESSDTVFFHLNNDAIRTDFDFFIGGIGNEGSYVTLSPGTGEQVTMYLPEQSVSEGRVTGSFRRKDTDTDPDQITVSYWKYNVRTKTKEEQGVLHTNTDPMPMQIEGMTGYADGLAGVAPSASTGYAFFWTQFRNTIEQMPNN